MFIYQGYYQDEKRKGLSGFDRNGNTLYIVLNYTMEGIVSQDFPNKEDRKAFFRKMWIILEQKVHLIKESPKYFSLQGYKKNNDHYSVELKQVNRGCSFAEEKIEFDYKISFKEESKQVISEKSEPAIMKLSASKVAAHSATSAIRPFFSAETAVNNIKAIVQYTKLDMQRRQRRP